MKKYFLQNFLFTVIVLFLININSLFAQADFNGEMYVEIYNPATAL